MRISAKSDTRFGKYSDSRFGLNSDTFRSGATPERDSYSTVRIEVKCSAAEELLGAEGDARLSEGGEPAAWAVPKRGSAAADRAFEPSLAVGRVRLGPVLGWPRLRSNGPEAGPSQGSSAGADRGWHLDLKSNC